MDNVKITQRGNGCVGAKDGQKTRTPRLEQMHGQIPSEWLNKTKKTTKCSMHRKSNSLWIYYMFWTGQTSREVSGWVQF